MKQGFNKTASKKTAAGLAAASVAAALLCNVFSGAAAEAPPPSRPLTQGETALAQHLFGKELDLSSTRIVFHAGSNGRTDRKKHTLIRVKGKPSHDYSRETNPGAYGAFVRRLTRLWQDRTSHAFTNTDFTDLRDERDYPLDTSRWKFFNYAAEQQASIMEDYALRFFHPSHRANQMEKTYGTDNCDADESLAYIVENQFPWLRQTRQALSGEKTRKLTRNEAALIRSIFGNRVDTAAVTFRFDERYCARRAGSLPVWKDVHYWGKTYWSADYSLEKNAFNFGLFIHEITHVWQKQTSFAETNWRFVNKPNEYDYPIDLSRWAFSEYGVEQQAAIVEDYARCFLQPSCATGWAKTSKENREALATLVENQFPEAKATRIYYQQHKTLPVPAMTGSLRRTGP